MQWYVLQPIKHADGASPVRITFPRRGGSPMRWLIINPLHGKAATLSSSCGAWQYQYDSSTLLYKCKSCKRSRPEVHLTMCQVLLTDYIRQVHISCHTSFWVVTCHGQPYSKRHILGILLPSLFVLSVISETQGIHLQSWFAVCKRPYTSCGFFAPTMLDPNGGLSAFQELPCCVDLDQDSS